MGTGILMVFTVPKYAKRDEMGVLMPKTVWWRNASVRAAYKAKRNLPLTQEEAEALVALERKRSERRLKQVRERMNRKAAKDKAKADAKLLGIPPTAKLRNLVESIAKAEVEQGCSTWEAIGELLGIAPRRIGWAIKTYSKWYLHLVEELYRTKARKIEETVARERIESTARLLALNKLADQALADALASDAALSIRIKAAKQIKETIGMTQADVREDAKLHMMQEQHAGVRDTLDLLKARGRLALASEIRKPEIEAITVEAEVIEDE